MEYRCFERSKQKHSFDCKKHPDRISNAFESTFVNKPKIDSSTCYSDAYKMFQMIKSSSQKSDYSVYNENVLSQNLALPIKVAIIFDLK